MTLRFHTNWFSVRIRWRLNWGEIAKPELGATKSGPSRAGRSKSGTEAATYAEQPRYCFRVPLHVNVLFGTLSFTKLPENVSLLVRRNFPRSVSPVAGCVKLNVISSPLGLGTP